MYLDFIYKQCRSNDGQLRRVFGTGETIEEDILPVILNDGFYVQSDMGETRE